MNWTAIAILPRQLLLVAMLFTLWVTGCSAFAEKGSPSQAKKFVESEINAWMAGTESQVKTYSMSIGVFIGQSPLSYQVRSVTESTSRVMSLRDVAMLESGKDENRVYRIVVDLQFKDPNKSSISKIVEYFVTWRNDKQQWGFAIGS